MTGTWIIRNGGLEDRRVIALLDAHVRRARAETARGSAHALDLSGLKAPDILFWSVWNGEEAVGVGALRRLTSREGEVKSMYVPESRRGQGIAGALLDHIIAEARGAGHERLSLETGSWDYFIPARALYVGRGFAECAPFGDYAPDPNSVFMTLDLTTTP